MIVTHYVLQSLWDTLTSDFKYLKEKYQIILTFMIPLEPTIVNSILVAFNWVNSIYDQS